jgi:hypothetical protein
MNAPAALDGGQARLPDPAGFATFFARARHEPIYVILGVQGSGTNLLRRLLDTAFDFSVVQDQSVVFNVARSLGTQPSADAIARAFEGLRSRMLPSAFERKTLRRVKSNGSFEGVDRAFDPSLVTTGADLAQFVYAYSGYSRGSLRLAIKSDDLWETIGDIDAVIPNRRIILLTRDLRDNLLSITNKDFGPKDPLVAAAYVKERFGRYDAEYQRTPADRRFHVTFEELLEAPEDFVARFWTHFHLGAPGEAPPAIATEKIRRNNKRKWAVLAPRQLEAVEAVLRDELVRYGYELDTQAAPEPSSAEWMSARLRDTLQRVPQKIQKVAARFAK